MADDVLEIIDERDPIQRAIADAEERKGSPLTGDEVDAIVKSHLDVLEDLP